MVDLNGITSGGATSNSGKDTPSVQPIDIDERPALIESKLRDLLQTCHLDRTR